MKLFPGLVVAIAAFTSILSGASAQSYPVRPIKLIVPFAAGTGIDSMARLVAQGLSKEFGQPVIVDNRAGASGTIGVQAVAKASPDGYTLLMAGSATHSSANVLLKNVPYDVEADFQPISNFIDADFIVAVRKESPIKSIADLTMWLKAQEKKASFAYGSVTTQVAGISYLKLIGADAVAVPYKGNSIALNDLLGGQIDFMFIDQTLALPHIAGGRIRPLAVAARQRRSDLPDVPTTLESKIDLVITAWIGLMAPAGIPVEIKTKLSQASSNLLRDPAVREKMASSGRVSLPQTPDTFVTYLKGERQSWEAKVRAAGIEPQ